MLEDHYPLRFSQSKKRSFVMAWLNVLWRLIIPLLPEYSLIIRSKLAYLYWTQRQHHKGSGRGRQCKTVRRGWLFRLSPTIPHWQVWRHTRTYLICTRHPHDQPCSRYRLWRWSMWSVGKMNYIHLNWICSHACIVKVYCYLRYLL